MLTGGQTPGTAQLAATAAASVIPESRVKITGSPDSASTAGSRTTRPGHSWTGRRAAIAARRPRLPDRLGGEGQGTDPASHAPGRDRPGGRCCEPCHQVFQVEVDLDLTRCRGQLSRVQIIERGSAGYLGGHG
jgi:hypothetical protein